MLFPAFDKLTPGELPGLTDLLQQAGYEQPGRSAEILVRLRTEWDGWVGGDVGDAGSASQFSEPPGTSEPTPQNTVPNRQFTTIPPWFRILRRVLQDAPFRSRVLESVERYVLSCADRASAFRLFNEVPRALDILARISCISPFLTQTMLADPGSLEDFGAGGRISEARSREDFIAAAADAVQVVAATGGPLDRLREFQRRELLRIAVCDAFGLMELRMVTLQLSLLADAMVHLCLQLAADGRPPTELPLAVLALGKQGGEELNYSSDIDLVFICSEDASDLHRIARRTVDALADQLPSGFLYRVDLRLRPWGDAGPLVATIDAYETYLTNAAQLWERQALLKARFVAGNSQVAADFLARAQPRLFTATSGEVRAGIRRMKEKIEERLRSSRRLTSEVKLGMGSIRDIEFVVQCLQLSHGSADAHVVRANTLEALSRLADRHYLSAAWFRRLRSGYIFLRTIEHSLQLLHNQQTHELPNKPGQLEWLALRLDFPDSQSLLNRFDEYRHSIRGIFEAYFAGADAAEGEADEDSAGETEAERRDDSKVLRWEQTQSARQYCLLKQSEEISAADYRPLEEPGLWQMVVSGPDTSGVLSCLCGLLAMHDFDVRDGRFCAGICADGDYPVCGEGTFSATFLIRRSPTAVRHSRSEDEQDLSQLTGDLHRMMGLLATGGQDEVRGELLDRFCRYIESQAASSVTPGPMIIEVGDEHEVGTEVRIRADDKPGFLFELSNACALSGFRLRRAAIHSRRDSVEDVLYVTESDGQPVRDEQRLQELRTAVAMIGQFTHWLPSSGNPSQSLQQFRELIRLLLPAPDADNQLRSLSAPQVLRASARLLGVGRYLWEDFLRRQHQELLPLLRGMADHSEYVTRAALEAELKDRLSRADSAERRFEILNSFKDRHLFRIDMRHLLGHCRGFGTFSFEITELAEVVVNSAFTIAYELRRRIHGTPIAVSTSAPCRYAIAGLGKFGGVEMGFASDIELLLIFEDHGRTDGLNSAANATFFDRVVTDVTNGISARRDGIFRIDTRMRPHGHAGTAAIALGDFRSYYGPSGASWPFERQALVKLRIVSEQSDFSEAVQTAQRKVVFDRSRLDMGAIRAMRERQIQQLVPAGTTNAKLSEGGLADCEYGVQALQMYYGGQHAELCTPNTLQALQAACTLGLVERSTADEVTAAYQFLRELIDCMRMERGNAGDLTVPPDDSPEYAQLARRMQSVHDSETALEEREAQFRAVRQWFHLVEQMCEQDGV